MHTFALFAAVFISTTRVVRVSTQDLPEDATLSTIGLATKYGYPPQAYEVVTDDGYILTIYRLPGKSRIPVLLTHGFLDSSDTWLIRGNTSLAITLANDGYDVWLTNSRGNRYSRRHKNLDPDRDSDFWQFTFHEMGYYDLPAMIDKILQETGAPTVTSIGHSQGNTIYYVMGSTRPEYNSKITVMIALAPIAFYSVLQGLYAVLVSMRDAIKEIIDVLRIHELLGDTTLAAKTTHTLCPIPDIGYALCFIDVIFPQMGIDIAELEPEFERVCSTHYPAGTSSLGGLHLLQLGARNLFSRYDYGSELNMKIYNSSEPPLYPLNKITMPIALFAARNDLLSSVVDVENLKQQLPNVVYHLVNPYSAMNHLDYIWGKNMGEYLYPYIYDVLGRINSF